MVRTSDRLLISLMFLLVGAGWAASPPEASTATHWGLFLGASLIMLLMVLLKVVRPVGDEGAEKGRPTGRPPYRVLRGTLATVLALVAWTPFAAAFVGMPRGASFRQDAIFDLFVLTTIAALILTVITLVLLVALGLRYRDRGEGPSMDPAMAPLVRRLVMAGFILVPTLVIFGIGVVSFQVLDMLDDRPEEGTEVEVMAVQFAWRFQYPDGSVTRNELYVEEGEPVILRLTSADVIHSLFIPDMGVKMDVNPGMTTETWFQPERSGTYGSYCSEWCGVGHPEMHARIIVLPEGSTIPPNEAVIEG